MQNAKQKLLSAQSTDAAALQSKITAAISAAGGRVDYVEVDMAGGCVIC